VPNWFAPLAAASLTVLFLNVALWAQGARARAKGWPTQFRRELHRWDGLVPDELDQEEDLGSDLPV
jgi:hypothetical protein